VRNARERQAEGHRTLLRRLNNMAESLKNQRALISGLHTGHADSQPSGRRSPQAVNDRLVKSLAMR